MGRQVAICGWRERHWAALGAKADEFSPGTVWVDDRFEGPVPKAHPIETLGEAHLFFYLVRQDDLPKLVTEHAGSQGEWVLDGLRSPAIECFRGSTDGSAPGRLYVRSGYWTDDERWVAADAGLLRWYDALARWIRRSFIRGSDRSCYQPADTPSPR